MNGDNVLSSADAVGFISMIRDPDAYLSESGRTLRQILDAADFDDDGEITTADIPGFCDVMNDALGTGGGMRQDSGGGDGLLDSTGTADLDVDSDNNNEAGQPERSAGEDSIEADTDKPGKFVLVNDDDDDEDGVADMNKDGTVTGEDDLIPLVMEITPGSGVTPISTSLKYQLDFPDSVRIWPWANSQRGPLSQRVIANQDRYWQVWILGDMDGSAAFDGGDMSPFFLALSDYSSYQSQYPGIDGKAVGDMNGDGGFDGGDIDPFFTLLVSGPVKHVPVRFWIEGLESSARLGDIEITLDADTDADASLDSSDEVHATTWWPDRGYPRAWEAGMEVSPFSSVNLHNGNMITEIPIVSFDPVGPPVSISVYHNSAISVTGESQPWGFDLGDGWRISYGGSVEGTYTDPYVTVIEDDGARNVFAWNSTAQKYVAPPGVHDYLSWDTTNQEWVLLCTSQNKRVFDSAGRLIEIHDSIGNVLSVERDANNGYRISAIVSAAENNGSVQDHRVDFNYDGNGRLYTLTDPIDRTWEFQYDNDYRLWKLQIPHDQNDPARWFQFGYDDLNRLDYIISRDQQQWDFDYDSDTGKLASVLDPAADQYSSRYGLAFEFGEATVDGLWPTIVTDRRDYEWKYEFSDVGEARKTTDPLSKVRQWTYDSDHNAVTFTNELNKMWTMTYGAVGNMATLSTPITNQTWELDWEQPDSTNRPNFWRVIETTDPLSHWTQYDYDDEDDPTHVTSIVEQEPEQGGSTTTTSIDYYDPAEINAAGQLRLVVDGNSVNHFYQYDDWGYFAALQGGIEGGIDFGNPNPTCPNCYSTASSQTNDAAGCVLGGTNDIGWDGTNSHDPDGHPIGILCAYPYNPSQLPLRLINASKIGSYHYGSFSGCLENADYDLAGRPTLMETCGQDSQRTYGIDYDNLGRPTLTSFATNDFNPAADPIERGFRFTLYDQDGRVLEREDADSQETTYSYDELGRAKTVDRSGMGVTYTYDDAGRLARTDYDNGTAEVRHYDDAGRLDWIEQRDDSEQVMLRTAYTWELDNTIETRQEIDYTGQTTTNFTTTFEYDNRQRLTREVRVNNSTATAVYDLNYTYDGLGNRLTKVDDVSDLCTTYFYDSDSNNRDPNYQTNNNRLLWYEVRSGDCDTGTLLRTVRYVYYKTGDVCNITIKDEYVGSGTEADFAWYYDLAFTYYSNGMLGLAVWGRWHVNQNGYAVDYEQLAAREFRYHGPRERFLTRDVDPAQLLYFVPVGDQQWTEYATEEPYNDLSVALDPQTGDPSSTGQTRYLDGIQAQQDASAGTTMYLHGDLIRSTNMTSDGNGAALSTVAYSAFGEVLNASGQPGDNAPAGFPRYQHAGGWGYESGLLALQGAPASPLPSITLQHLGWRWYQPDAGRFLQRDPIGISGGLNVYGYVASKPVLDVDPAGLSTYGLEHEGPYGPGGPYTVPHRPPPPAPPAPPKPRRTRPRFHPHLGPLQPLLKLHSICIYTGIGGLGATIGQAVYLLFGVPIWSSDPDHTVFMIYRKFGEGWVEVYEAEPWW